jgi:hypothetical protein
MTTSRCRLVLVSLAVVLTLVLGYRVIEMSMRAPETGRTAGEDSEAPEIEVMVLRIRAKDRIVRDLARGRYSLFEAAALFRELDRVPPEVTYPAVSYPPPPLELVSPTEDERYCVTVIAYARNSLEGSEPDRARALTERLVAAFWAERFGRGDVRLPEATALEPLRELLGRAH